MSAPLFAWSVVKKKNESKKGSRAANNNKKWGALKTKEGTIYKDLYPVKNRTQTTSKKKKELDA